MTQICLAREQKSGLLNRTLYRIAAVGIATLITQASPGGVASSWGVECLTDLTSNSYCVTTLKDDISLESPLWTLRRSVDEANTRAATSATIGFSQTLFIDGQGAPKPGKLVLNSTLEIKTDITISGPIVSSGSPLLTVERGSAIETGTPLIAINPGGIGKATGEVKIEGIIIDSNANPTTGDLASGGKANPGVAIQVTPAEIAGVFGPTYETPTIIIKSASIVNAVSETGGAAINTPGDVRLENSNLSGNMAVTPLAGSPSDGGAIKSEGKVTVIGSGLYENSATGNGGAISAKIVEVTTDSSVYANSMVSQNISEGDGGAISAESVLILNGTILEANKAGGDGGAISATGSVTVHTASMPSNSAGGVGGAISAETVTVSASVLGGNFATKYGGAIAAAGNVEVNTSIFAGNESSLGGAIYSEADVRITSIFDKSNQVTTPGINEVIKQSSFSENFAEGFGGAIAAVGLTSKVEIDNSVFEGNFAEKAGGAIFLTGNLEVTNKSEFTGNIASESPWSIADARESCNEEAVDQRRECAIQFLQEWGFGPIVGGDVFGFQGGGAIYGINPEIFFDPINDSGEDRSNSPTASIQDSLFSQNSAEGNGGAIYFLGLIQLLGSRFEQNLSLPAQVLTNNSGPWGDTFERRGFGGAVYGLNLEVTASTFEENLAVLGGGAIYAEEKVDVLAPQSYTSASKSNQFINNMALDYESDFGQGGAISAGGPVSIKDANFQGNFASDDGGAVYSLQGVAIINSVFGLSPINNPNYNPVVGSIINEFYSPEENIPNLNYNPLITVPNPNYNPLIQVRNPNYNISVTREIVNPDYNINVPRLLRNPDCPSDSWFYEGVDYGNGILYECEFNRDGNYYQIHHVINPLYDDREMIPNPEFDELEMISVLRGPSKVQDDVEDISVLTDPAKDPDDRELILNPVRDLREYLPVLRFSDRQEDSRKYLYLGNQSGGRGGAIYVEGPTTVMSSNFSGNASGWRGGAIYSEGALQIEDSEFTRNMADGPGGAIRAKPGEAELLIARTSFVENVSTSYGGAISISTGTVEHYDDLIIASLFRANEALVSGGAIASSYANLILDTFEDNIAPEGQALYLDGGLLFGNFIMGASTGPGLCAGGVISGSDNFATDSSCFEFEENSKASNSVLTRSEKMDLVQALSLPQKFENDILSRFGDYLPSAFDRDFNGDIRDISVPWTAGHLQRIFPTPTITPPVTPEVTTPPMIDKGKDIPEQPQLNIQEENLHVSNQVVILEPSSGRLNSLLSILDPATSAEDLAKIAQLRAEQLAKFEAAKLARAQVRELAAEKRRAQLLAVSKKIADTKARGEALKQKSSWINLMRGFNGL